MFSIWRFLTHTSRFTTMVIITIVFLGVSAIVSIPKESAPSVEVPIAVVSTVLPGASPEDVERLVTNILEGPLKNTLKDVKTITSQSGSGFSSITIEFDTKADLTQSLADTRDIVDTHKNELPSDALEPQVIQIDFANDPVVTATLAADIPSEILFAIAEDVKDDLEDIKGVASVTLSGVEPREVSVVLDSKALAFRGLTVSDVVNALAAANASFPIGSLEERGMSFPVRFNGDIQDTRDVENIPILALGGAPVYVRDIATVIDERALPTSISRTSIDGSFAHTSVTIEVQKSSGANITEVSSATRSRIAQLQKPSGLLENIDVAVSYDSGALLKDDLTTLTKSGLQTIALVTFVLFLAVGWREALIAAISIPLSFLTAFIGLTYSGNTLNFVSLFALILSIGVIVDSTIVVVEGINRRLHELTKGVGEDENARLAAKEDAALHVVRDFHVPLTTGTLTTVAVFAPLFIVSGITGEFIKSIPFTIIFVLLASLLVALGFVPLLTTKILRRGETAVSAFAHKRDAFVRKSEAWYRAVLMRILKERETQNIFIVTLIILFVMALSLPSVGAVRVVFFEDSNADYVVVEAELPVGSILSATDLEARKIEDVLYAIPEISSFVTTVGRSSSFSDPFAGASGSERFANIFINLKEKRSRTTSTIVDEIRASLRGTTLASVRVSELSDGPPSAAPVGITLSSESLEDLEIAARRVEEALRTISGTTDIDSSMKDATSEFVLHVNRDEAVALGADPRSVATTLRAVLEGVEATTIKQLDEDIDIVVRLATRDLATPASDARNTKETTIDALQQVYIHTSQGRYPLGTFLDVSVEPSRAGIAHKAGERVASVSSFVTDGGNAVEITNALVAQLPSLALPASVTVTTGGESADVDQSFKDMFTALILGLIGMFAILVLQFNSFRYALYVLAIVPLSLIGVFTGLMITGSPLSFPSIMGFIALSGIVVNNAIILIDTIIVERRRSEGEKTMQEIVVDAASSRLRPVLLTALTTVVGVVPLLFAAAIWVPLAYALMFGLSFSTIITLVLVPVIYSRWPGSLTR